MVDGEKDRDQGEDDIELRRRDALSLPLTGMIGYGALSEAVGQASGARDPDESVSTNSIVDPSETTMYSLPVPSSANTVEAKIHAKISASTVS